MVMRQALTLISNLFCYAGYGLLYCRRGGQNIKYEGNFEADDLRFGKIVWDDGSVYTGEIHNFLPNGTGRKGYPEGSVYFGHWWNGLRDGHGRLSYPNADVLECEFNYDKPCGQVRIRCERTDAQGVGV